MSDVSAAGCGQDRLKIGKTIAGRGIRLRVAYYNENDACFKAYLVTNTVSGKQYVGITCKPLKRRWQNHVADARRNAHKFSALGRAIRKYGPDAFEVTWIASARSWADLLRLEVALIRDLGTKGPHGYNMTDGGEGTVNPSDEIRRAMAARSTGRVHSEEARRKIGEASKGHPVTPDAREKIGATHRGRKLSSEHRAKLSASKLGKKLPERTPEHCARISEGLRRAWAKR